MMASLIPQNKSFNHISFNILTNKNDLHTLVEKFHESHLRAFLSKFAKVPGLGGEGVVGQPNFGNARILGAYGPPTHP